MYKDCTKLLLTSTDTSFAEKCLFVIQGPRAEAMMMSAMERGKWVFFQNCHLSPSWMPSMERLIEHIDPDKVSSI